MVRIPKKDGRGGAGRRPKSLGTDGDTRAAILAAARSVFARRGFDGTSTREVALAANVNSAMIFYHFKDKVQLYRAVLADSFSAFDRIWEHPVFQSSAPARHKIKKFVEEFIRFQHANDELRRILSMEFASCETNCKWLADNFFTHSHKRLGSILREGMRGGELRRVDPTLAIATLIGMVIHTFILRPIAEYVTGRSFPLPVQQFGSYVTDLFFDGLGADAPSRSNPDKRKSR